MTECYNVFILYFRIKSFEFQEKGYQFDIPRILTLSDCGFRILFTKFDHYSSTCKTFYPRKKKKEGNLNLLLLKWNRYQCQAFPWLVYQEKCETTNQVPCF